MTTPLSMLRIAITVEWLTIALLVISAFAFENALPAEIQDYLDAQDEKPLTSKGYLNLGLACGLLIANLISSIGLWFARRWARIPYVVIAISFILWSLLDGPTLMPAYQYVLDQFAVLASGIIVALCFYSDVEWQPKAETALPSSDLWSPP